MKCKECGAPAYYRVGNDGWRRWECPRDGWAMEWQEKPREGGR